MRIRAEVIVIQNNIEHQDKCSMCITQYLFDGQEQQSNDLSLVRVNVRRNFAIKACNPNGAAR